MQESADRFSDLFRQGVCEESINRAYALCLERVNQEPQVCCWLAIGCLLGIVRARIGDRPLPVQEAKAIQDLLTPVLQELPRDTGASPSDACRCLDDHAEKIRALLAFCGV